MVLLPEHWWLEVALAAALAVDVGMSLKPPTFIRDCLNGVGFPRQWWWTLIVIKSLAITGLLVGLAIPGIGLAATVGVIVYFSSAVVAHIRARFLGMELWVNCMGFLTLALATLLFGSLF
ncbi:DoxX family protein [Cryobacterium sp. Y11]|uniref:DoxX family protein n=1 Tax=Cryobacterium sp. Y11 TaxID=2045016 RepID=UPI000CE4B9BE|nr:DoxX family protein [Cryobacterium sp. Y11]